ncbi:MAG TPA: IPT/TIG domain-containing protein [Solirubrobacteraceae bacterium]|nr:IPT/TIG domain-containing protein [Solirubrobacteraceae bacterium]
MTTQPTSQTVEEGQAVTFSAAASGVPTPTVQWELSTNGGASWSPLEGATAGQVTVASASTFESGYEYRAVFRNSVGTATSKAAILTVQNPPAVTGQPASTTVEEGHSAVFDATASGFPAPTVQWQTSTNGGSTWSNLSGATSNPLTLTNVKTSSNGHEYRAVFKNAAGTATREAATLTVQLIPSVTRQPASTAVEEGHNAVFEATASGFPAPTVQWEISTDGGSTWSNEEGATSNQLTIADAKTSEDGYEYRAVFQNAAGTARSNAATLTVRALPVITLQPAGTIVEVGEGAAFEATASGFPAPTVQWEISTNGGGTWSAVAGATSDQLTIAQTQASESGNEYRAVFTNAAGKTTSSAATLTVATNHYSAVGWGDGAFGQLGDGAFALSDVPVPVHGLKFVTAVAAGGHHSLALLADGTVVAWGANSHGQLGNGGGPAHSVPVAAEGLTGVKAISAGGNHSLALLKNGTVMAWGDNENGQLGIGSGVEDVEEPVAVKGLTNVKAISAGGEFSLALLTNGTVMAWGDNEDGQLGDGKAANSNVPVAVKGLTGVTGISAGGEFGLALLKNGTVTAWGDNEDGQLGDSGLEEATSNVPVPVGTLTGVTAIAAGATHGLAMLSGGTVMAWGEDAFGELGSGTIKASEATPVPVTGLSGATAISAGGQDSVALLGSGSVMTWGIDKWGNLGDGVTGGVSDVPVPVVGLRKVASVSAGRAHVLAYGEPIPTVTSVSPSAGPLAGGNTVTITGVEFTGATAVRFGAAEATGFTVDSATSITATAPPGTGTVDVTVTTPSGISPTGSSDRYTYQPAPTVKKLSAKSGPAAGGTVVTIAGTEFTGATQVSFGGASAAHFTVNSPTSITATSPAAAGEVIVTVTNAGGTSAASKKARFEFIPSVEGVTPNTGSAAGGTSVTVTGSGFALGTAATSFKFGKAKATSVECTSGTSCTMLAPAHEAGTVDVTAAVGKAGSPVNAPGDQFTYG